MNPDNKKKEEPGENKINYPVTVDAKILRALVWTGDGIIRKPSEDRISRWKEIREKIFNQFRAPATDSAGGERTRIEELEQRLAFYHSEEREIAELKEQLQHAREIHEVVVNDRERLSSRLSGLEEALKELHHLVGNYERMQMDEARSKGRSILLAGSEKYWLQSKAWDIINRALSAASPTEKENKR